MSIVIQITGEGLSSKMLIQSKEDFEILDKLITKVKKTFYEVKE